MAKNNNVEVYELSGRKYVKCTTDQPVIADSSHYDMSTSINLDSGKAAFLRGNPFLYNETTAPFPVTSLEEYLISFKKEEMAFGDIIRNPKFSPRKRKKIVKNTFKKWDNDYSTQKIKAFKENDKTVEVIGGVNFLRVPFKIKIILIVTFIFMVIIIAPTSSFWGMISSVAIGYRFNNALLNVFENTYWLKIVGNTTVYLLLIMLFYSSIYNVVSKDFTKEYQLAQNFLNKSEKTISLQYKKKYRKAYKYYLSNINNKKNPYIAPLDIKEVEEGQLNISTFNTICQATVDKAYNLKKRKPYYIAVKNFLLFLSLGGAATTFGYLLYKMVIGLIN